MAMNIHEWMTFFPCHKYCSDQNHGDKRLTLRQNMKKIHSFDFNITVPVCLKYYIPIKANKIKYMIYTCASYLYM